MHPDLSEGRVVVVLVANVVTCEQIFLTFPTEWMCVGPVMKGVKDRMPIVLSIACTRPNIFSQNGSYVERNQAERVGPPTLAPL